MTIKAKFQIVIDVTVGLVLTFGVLIVFTNQKLNKLDKAHQIAEAMYIGPESGIAFTATVTSFIGPVYFGVRF